MKLLKYLNSWLLIRIFGTCPLCYGDLVHWDYGRFDCKTCKKRMYF